MAVNGKRAVCPDLDLEEMVLIIENFYVQPRTKRLRPYIGMIGGGSNTGPPSFICPAVSRSGSRSKSAHVSYPAEDMELSCVQGDRPRRA